MTLTGRFGTQYRSATVRDGPFGRGQYTIVYAIDAPDIGRVKFGQTINIEKRFRGISSMSPAPLVLLGYVWMIDEAESAIFKYLQADRCHGEWFHRTEPVRSIAALIAAKQVEHLAEVIGLEGKLVKQLASNVSWGAWHQ